MSFLLKKTLPKKKTSNYAYTKPVADIEGFEKSLEEKKEEFYNSLQEGGLYYLEINQMFPTNDIRKQNVEPALPSGGFLYTPNTYGFGRFKYDFKNFPPGSSALVLEIDRKHDVLKLLVSPPENIDKLNTLMPNNYTGPFSSYASEPTICYFNGGYQQHKTFSLLNETTEQAALKKFDDFVDFIKKGFEAVQVPYTFTLGGGAPTAQKIINAPLIINTNTTNTIQIDTSKLQTMCSGTIIINK
jgi:hypothetical protein